MRRDWLVPLVRIIAVATVPVGVAAIVWLGVGSQSSTPVSAATHFIPVGDLWFCDSSFQGGDCETTINVGDSVTWGFDTAVLPHTSTECTGSCGSALANPGSRLWHSGDRTSGTFERTFNSPGTFQYQCNIHPVTMRGTIIVNGAVPTLPVPPSPIPSETATPVSTLPMPPSPIPSETATPVATLPMPPSPAPSETATLVPTLPMPPSPVPSETDTPVPTLTPTPVGVRGDANCNGTVDPIDAALILQFNVRLISSLSCEQNADVNQDMTINAIDAALILQLVAGLIPNLPP